MEITAKPRHRGRVRAFRAVLVVGAMWGVALLIPPALGLQTQVIDDRAIAGTHARGSLVFDEEISPMLLEVGDVVTFVPPEADASVTRRVVAIDNRTFQTQRDSAAAVDPWAVPLAGANLQRVAFSLPWAGYPLLALRAVTIPPWAPPALALGLAVTLVMRRRSSQRVVEEEPALADANVRARSGATATPPLT